MHQFCLILIPHSTSDAVPGPKQMICYMGADEAADASDKNSTSFGDDCHGANNFWQGK
jgi:hypothetical protein